MKLRVHLALKWPQQDGGGRFTFLRGENNRLLDPVSIILGSFVSFEFAFYKKEQEATFNL